MDPARATNSGITHSTVWGPVATEKSQSMVYLIAMLHIDSNVERTMVCPFTNVAVNQMHVRLLKIGQHASRKS